MPRRRSLHARVAAGLALVAGGAWWVALSDSDGSSAPFVTVVVQESAMPALTTSAPPRIGGDVLPADVALTRLDGSSVDSGDLIGVPLVLNFWYDTCAPCRAEMPAFDLVSDELGAGVRVVGVDPLNDAVEVRAFLDEVGVGYEQLLDTDGALAAALDITSFPATVLVTADGTITSAHLGALDADELTRLIADELGVS